MDSYLCLKQISGPKILVDKEKYYSISDTILFGREAGATILIPADERVVSRKHLSISFDENTNESILQNMGKSGTIINGEKLFEILRSHEKVFIITLGNYSFELEVNYTVETGSTKEYGKEISDEFNKIGLGVAATPPNVENDSGPVVDSSEPKSIGRTISPIQIVIAIVSIVILILFLIPKDDPSKSGRDEMSTSIDEIKSQDYLYPKISLVKELMQKQWTGSERNRIIELFNAASADYRSSSPERRWKAINKWEWALQEYAKYENLPIDIDKHYADYVLAVEELNNDISLLNQTIKIAKRTKNINSLENSQRKLDRLIPDKTHKIYLHFKKEILNPGVTR